MDPLWYHAFAVVFFVIALAFGLALVAAMAFKQGGELMHEHLHAHCAECGEADAKRIAELEGVLRKVLVWDHPGDDAVGRERLDEARRVLGPEKPIDGCERCGHFAHPAGPCGNFHGVGTMTVGCPCLVGRPGYEEPA